MQDGESSQLDLVRFGLALKPVDGDMATDCYCQMLRSQCPNTASFHDIAALLPDKDRIFSVSQRNTLEEAAASGQYAYAQKQGEAISRSTKEGMAKKRELGVVFGNPAILDVQRSGSAAASDKANILVRQIADVLIEIGDVSLTRNQVAAMLNSPGILTGQGKPWDASRIRVPLKKARALIANDEQKAIDDSYAANPLFGAF